MIGVKGIIRQSSVETINGPIKTVEVHGEKITFISEGGVHG